MDTTADRITASPAAAPSGALLASTRHTAIFLGIVGALTAMGALSAMNSPASEAAPSAATLLGGYAFMIFAQLMWLRFISKGMQQRGRSVREFLGRAWGLSTLATDVLLGAAACALVLAISSGIAHLVPAAQPQLNGLLPKGVLGMGLWLCMATAAGVCEEIAFRGYFQGQLAALTGKPWLAVIGQALLFGVAHSYQGLAATAEIALVGLVLGMLAQWRGNLRAGIVAHAALDIMAAVLGH